MTEPEGGYVFRTVPNRRFMRVALDLEFEVEDPVGLHAGDMHEWKLADGSVGLDNQALYHKLQTAVLTALYSGNLRSIPGIKLVLEETSVVHRQLTDDGKRWAAETIEERPARRDDGTLPDADA